MTRASIVEYVEAVRGRYIQASKKEKGKILGEFAKVTGCHRKAAIALIGMRCGEDILLRLGHQHVPVLLDNNPN